MLGIGYYKPLATPWNFTRKAEVNLSPWKYALPCAIVLVSLIISLYILFSPLGLVGGTSMYFVPSLIAVWTSAFLLSWWSVRRWHKRYQSSLAHIGVAKVT